ncbi:unnamed protein product [Protopolystoma xenopodis]|uniref:TATA element modulatory factor 1 TATA binding domain-containing protein n=1 Tax=Protopolystoma xenopodis TaxID=117903 RepID=A0A448XGU5_9PLAT|nr:unnamed protein product [Protopolystoma xenopodis]
MSELAQQTARANQLARLAGGELSAVRIASSVSPPHTTTSTSDHTTTDQSYKSLCLPASSEISDLLSQSLNLDIPISGVASESALNEPLAKIFNPYKGVETGSTNMHTANIVGDSLVTLNINRFLSSDDVTDELQRRYEALLQMYGELYEQNNELKLDLIDIKEMYKSQ